jgi:hypothetical protein
MDFGELLDELCTAPSHMRKKGWGYFVGFESLDAMQDDRARPELDFSYQTRLIYPSLHIAFHTTKSTMPSS